MTQFEFQMIDPRDRKHFVFHATLFRKIFVGTLRQVFRLIMKLDVQGLENFPLDGPVVVTCNHVTNFDVFPMQLSLPRPIFFMAKSELFKFPPMDVLVRNLAVKNYLRAARREAASSLVSQTISSASSASEDRKPRMVPLTTAYGRIAPSSASTSSPSVER